MTPSDTPRTDKRVSELSQCADDYYKLAEITHVARTIERELAAMTAERDGYAAECARLGGVVRAVSEDAIA